MERQPQSGLAEAAGELVKRYRAGSPPTPDLARMFEMQRRLCYAMAEVGKASGVAPGVSIAEWAFDDMMDLQGTEGVVGRRRYRVGCTLEQLVAMEMELAELRDWLPWKAWRADKGDVTPAGLRLQRAEVVMELADVLHFFINLCLLWGVSPQELAALYQVKNEENLRRVEGGY